MKHIVLVPIILLVTTISCAPTATPQLQAALASVTPQVATAIAMATTTPTTTPTSSSTPTVTPSLTNTPTQTPTLLPTVTKTLEAIPQELLKPPVGGTILINSTMRDLDQLKFPPDIYKQYGGYFKTGDYPQLGPGVMAYYDKNMPLLENRFRAYPSMWPGLIEGPHSVGVDIWLHPDSKPGYMSGAWQSVLSTYGRRIPDDPNAPTAACTNVNIQPTGNGKYLAILGPPDNPSRLARLVDNAPYFELGKKYRLELVVDKDREMRLYQTDLSVPNSSPHLVSWGGKLNDDCAVSFRGGHAGLYGGQNLAWTQVWNANLLARKLP